jgi:hypothetical protein
MHYLNSVFAANLVQTTLSLLFLEPNYYCVSAVQLHVNAADVLVRRGVDRGRLQIALDLCGAERHTQRMRQPRRRRVGLARALGSRQTRRVHL